MPIYHIIKCPICKNKFTKVDYKGRLKRVVCPYCGVKIDIDSNPQYEVEVFESSSLKRGGADV